MTSRPREVFDELINRFDERFEWLAVFPNGRTFGFQRNEIEIDATDKGCFIEFPNESGFRRWRIQAIDFDRLDVVMEVTGAFAKERTSVRLIPRTPAAELTREIEAARLARVNEIAAIFERSIERSKVLRAKLREAGGRLAELILRLRDGSEMAILSDVTESLTPENLMSSLLIWQRELDSRQKNSVRSVALAGTKKKMSEAARLCSLLRPGISAGIELYRIENERAVPLPEAKGMRLGSERITKPKPVPPKGLDLSLKIQNISPASVDIIAAAQGETLRFNGLPFARVRKLAEAENCWYGLGKRRRLLQPDNEVDLRLLINELALHRDANSENRRHDLFRAAPEAWLESILKRNIKLLDANLILSPIYDQFRYAMRKIDLLALRRDGRLAIVEIKTSPDREMVFQAAGYWRRIEAFRRKGEIERSGLFGERKILDKPTIVYTVAPALAFHHDFEFLAASLTPEIELWRFELHEDWRNEVKVIARKNYSLR